MLTAQDLELDEALARMVIRYATAVAPCLQSLEGEALEDAKAILLSIGRSLQDQPRRGVKRQTRGPWTTEYFSDSEISSIISYDDRMALQGLCGIGRSGSGGPVGRFPRPSRSLLSLWPEDR